MNRHFRLALALAAGALLLSGAARAQGVMTPGAMPPPPSLQESVKRSDSKPQKRRARQNSQGEAGSAAQTEATAPRRKLRASTAAPAPSGSGYSSRIDDRPQRAPSGAMQLEDDPRGLTPSMSNGRPGMGMRF